MTKLQNSIKKHRLNWIIVLTIFTISFVIKILAVQNFNFAMTYDQGRDLMEIRSIVIGHRPALVGPTTSINGAFLGPFWYYFNTIPFILGQGNPVWIMYWQILWYQLTGIAIYLILKPNTVLATITSSLFLLMPVGFYSNRYFWNAHAMPFVITWLILYLIYLTKPNQTNTKKSKLSKINLIFLGILAGIPLQIQAAFGILALPLTLLYIIKWKKKSFLSTNISRLTYVLTGFTLTLIPQFIYELRHKFSITQTLYAQFTGQTNILSQKLTFYNRLTDRWHYYTQAIIETNHLHPTIIIIIVFIALTYTLVKLFHAPTRTPNQTISTNLSKVSLQLLALSVILYLIFPQPLKDWYIKGLSVPIVFITSVFLTDLWQQSTFKNLPTHLRKTLINITKLLIVAFLISTTIKTIIEQNKYISASQHNNQNDPSNLSNQVQIIDWIYLQTKGHSFKVYSYLPSVYDYSYQHDFWWYGTKTYGYQPTKMSYSIQDVPEYIKSSQKIWTKTRYNLKNSTANDPKFDNDYIFLIIEPEHENPQHQQQWIKQFQNLCIQKQIEFPSRTIVQLRTNCHQQNQLR